MFNYISSIFAVPELKRRIYITLALLGVFSIGLHIPTPGVNSKVLADFFSSDSGSLFGFLNLFTGGALSQLAIFGLGVIPYISASIIMELMTVVFPSLGELKKQGNEGRELITRYARYLTVAFAFVQAYALSIAASTYSADVALFPGIFFNLSVAISLTTGTIFLMWIGERITIYGIGNGLSLLILSGILVRLPGQVSQGYSFFQAGALSSADLIFSGLLLVAVISFVVFMETAQRRIPVQYIRRGSSKEATNSYLPLKINISGVISIIFASSILSLPLTLGFLFEGNLAIQRVVGYFSSGSPGYYVLLGIFVTFFCFMYTSIVFSPDDVANNLNKSGGVIPGYRPGEQTAEFLDQVLTRLTTVGAIYVVIVAIFPEYIFRRIGIPGVIGGTTFLILVSVSIDTIDKINSQLLGSGYGKAASNKNRRY